MSLPMKLEQLHRKHAKLEAKVQSIGKKERTLREEVKMLKERLAIRKVEEKLRERQFPTLYGEKTVKAPHDLISEPEAQEAECIGVPVTLEILREMEILSDTEGRHVSHLARMYAREQELFST